MVPNSCHISRIGGPIANARNVPSRPRRRQGFPPVLRNALVVALILACCLLAVRLGVLSKSAGAVTGVLVPAPQQGPSQLAVPGIGAGACMSLPPTSGHTGQTVFIDPGHGGLDPGVVGDARGRQVLEKDATLAVATRLSDLLRADGYRVVLARTTDSSVLKLGAADSVTGAMTNDAVHRDLLARIACANASNATLLISIHFDGFNDASVGGTETFYDAQRPFEVSSKRLATDLQSALVAGLGSSDRGVWTDDQTAAPSLTSAGSNYGHLMELGPMASGWVSTPSQMPGALVEPLFVTNPAEAAVLSDPAGQSRIAMALEAGVLQYLSGG